MSNSHFRSAVLSLNYYLGHLQNILNTSAVAFELPLYFFSSKEEHVDKSSQAWVKVAREGYFILFFNRVFIAKA